MSIVFQDYSRSLFQWFSVEKNVALPLLHSRMSRAEQHASIVRALKGAAKIVEGSGVTLALEPLNDRVDHAGYYLTSTEEGLDIIDEVARRPHAPGRDHHGTRGEE